MEFDFGFSQDLSGESVGDDDWDYGAGINDMAARNFRQSLFLLGE